MAPLLLRYWPHIAGATILLSLAYGFWHRGNVITSLKDKVVMEQAKHAVTRQSLDKALEAIRDQNERVASLGAASRDVRTEADRIIREAQRRDKDMEEAFRKLAAASRAPYDECVFPAAVEDVWSGSR